jgi:predicted esterase
MLGEAMSSDPTVEEGSEDGNKPTSRWTRRRVLGVGVGAAAAIAVAGTAGVELVAHGVLPGKQLLDQVDGACSVASPLLQFSPLGESRVGEFFSVARNRSVGYTIAYPPGHRLGSELPLAVVLHGFGANHTDALAGMSVPEALALTVGGRPLRAQIAMVAADGGNGYWHPHPGDNPMAMVVDELIPMCRRLGLGRSPRSIGTLGISMGGYGALLFAERFPHLFAAVAAISPAIWTSYDEARNANAGAYDSARDFAVNDVVTHAGALFGTPVRIASGLDDPFFPGVEVLAKSLTGAVVDFSKGCHTDPFFVEQEPPSIAFLAQHLTAS